MTPIHESAYGLYVWKLPNGNIAGNSDGEYLLVESKIGDLKKITALSAAAKHYGYEQGEPLFLSGRRKVSSDEQDDQMERMLDGKIPDPYDIGNVEGEV